MNSDYQLLQNENLKLKQEIKNLQEKNNILQEKIKNNSTNYLFYDGY
jgi:uncharacterized protein YlxW (UPF0749 family)